MSATSLNKVPTLGTSAATPHSENGDVKSSTASSKSANSVSDEKEIAKEAASKDLENGDKETNGPKGEKEFAFKGKKMIGIMVALALSMFLAALDNTIVSTMLPKITEKFDSLSQMTWIISSYVVASTALQPMYGKLCHIYGHQYVMLAAHCFFLAGSIICGASTSSNMLIAGRTVAGVGGSGLMSLCFVVVGDFVPPAKSPMYMSVFAMVWAVASVVGPLLGGVFADKTGFKWGFYINPCIQAPVLLLIIFFMRMPRPRDSAIEKLKRIDFIGILTVVAGIVMLQLGLVWGGQEHPWKSAAVIIPLILGILLIFAFVLIEWKVPKEPIMPMRLFKSRNTMLTFLSQVTFGMVFFAPIFYFPLYLTVVRHASAINAGLHLISCMLGISLFSILSGVLIAKTGIYLPFIWAGVAVNVVGIGLFALFGSDPSNGMLIGLPIVFGVGIGFSMQPMLCCAQNAVAPEDVATTTTLFMTIRMLGSAIGLAVAQSVFQNRLAPFLTDLLVKFPDNADTIKGIVNNQAVIWESGVPTELRSDLIDAYVKSLRMIYYVFIAFSGLSLITTLFLKNIPLRKNTVASPNE
ncbi:hypothetical protein IW140_003978 [Coemansia sp. RSA 1813]|nr:hypothetical protein EV178_003848 [Coemansia sp. RSA 1646]KAJ1767821.1 hypothetical protein LPJ74_005161 [Coemansia sp. RSA 1843]KAJ2088562.1 hypothetical protein IW138_004152 [Coemansia sp. RSA 986]KAJ2213443.1 hypothetical protein EV179_003862 [Coemansia sp. RSA 487]KAJ2568340.1 hypothetical protein IW140_003978 [Coemansia sp. RSA 1813]